MNMNTTPINYCEWDWHVVDVSSADDGFGNLVLTDLDMFWHNSDRAEESRRSEWPPAPKAKRFAKLLS